MTHYSGNDWEFIVAPWHLDEDIPAFPIPSNAAETIRTPLPDGAVPDRMKVLHQAVANVVAHSSRPLVLSGDCPTAVGALAGLQRRYDELAVVWLDAHGDFNTPGITTSGYLGGMALSMLTGRTPGLVDDSLGLRPLPETAVVLADARDLDPAEDEALTASEVRRVPADPAALTDALGKLGRIPVYLHLDVDVIDSSQSPGLRFPSGPGPTLARIERCLEAVCSAAEVAGAGIACAWLPDRVDDRTTRATISRLTEALGAHVAWHE